MSEPELIWLAKQAQTHNRIVEIGSYLGRSTRALADNTEGFVVAVDDWYGPRDTLIAEKMRAGLFDIFSANLEDHIKSGKVIVQRVDHNNADVDFVPDMVFIDGSHDYDSVKRDVSKWWPKLEKGGLLCGHDAVPCDAVGICDVWRAAAYVIGGEKMRLVDGTTIFAALK